MPSVAAMDAASELDRRVTHVEDETVHIYDLIEERSAEFRQRFDELRQRLDGVDQRLDGVDQRLDSVDQRLDSVDHRLDGVEQTLAEHSLAFAEILRRLPDSR